MPRRSPRHWERWNLAQECQLINQLAKKSRLLESDKKSVLSRHLRYSSSLFQLLSRFREIVPDSKILEVGSGPHGVIFFYPGGFRVALDPLALLFWQEFAFFQSGSDARLVQGVGETLPFPDLCFDYVLSDNVLDHTADAQAVLSEIHRVLKGDGFFLLTVNCHHWAYRAFSLLFSALFSLNIRLRFHNYRTHTYFFTLSALKRLIRKSGFTVLFESMPVSKGSNARPHAALRLFIPFRHVRTVFVCAKQQLVKHT